VPFQCRSRPLWKDIAAGVRAQLVVLPANARTKYVIVAQCLAILVSEVNDYYYVCYVEFSV
jgi:hypothetical protein